MSDMVQAVERGARISECGRFRYTLLRKWGPKKPGMTWVMCNPSTADAEIDDPTIRRVMAFTQREGHDAALVVNLFAMRATDPMDVMKAALAQEEFVGPENGQWVGMACRQAAVVVAAWGAIPRSLNIIRDTFVDLIVKDGIALKCLGKTKHGQPRHPLYVRADEPLVEWKK